MRSIDTTNPENIEYIRYGFFAYGGTVPADLGAIAIKESNTSTGLYRR